MKRDLTPGYQLNGLNQLRKHKLKELFNSLRNNRYGTFHKGMDIAMIGKGTGLVKCERKHASGIKHTAVECVRIRGDCMLGSIIVHPLYSGTHADLKIRRLEGKIADHNRATWIGCIGR